MGYTHYYNLKKLPENFKESCTKVLYEVQFLHDHLPSEFVTANNQYDAPAVICDGGGQRGTKPQFRPKSGIRFNGCEELSHETFLLPFETFDFEFCKTARKPYDFFVCLCLISMGNHVSTFEYSSDGDISDWQPAIDFYKSHFTLNRLCFDEVEAE